MGDVTITGSINGGGGNDSGVIAAQAMGYVTIGGSITGGTAQNAGAVRTPGTLNGVHVSGDVTGGSDAFTEVIAFDRRHGRGAGGQLTGRRWGEFRRRRYRRRTDFL